MVIGGLVVTAILSFVTVAISGYDMKYDSSVHGTRSSR